MIHLPSVYLTISDYQSNITESQEMSSCKGNSVSVLGSGLLFISQNQISVSHKLLNHVSKNYLL